MIPLIKNITESDEVLLKDEMCHIRLFHRVIQLLTICLRYGFYILYSPILISVKCLSLHIPKHRYLLTSFLLLFSSFLLSFFFSCMHTPIQTHKFYTHMHAPQLHNIFCFLFLSFFSFSFSSSLLFTLLFQSNGGRSSGVTFESESVQWTTYFIKASR